MEEIVSYFTDIFHLRKEYELPANIVAALNRLDRAERGSLKARLFNEAKRLGQGGDGIRAIRWLETAFEQIEKNSFRLHEVLFSPGQDIPENLSYHISRAKARVDLCVYTISDEALGRCLLAVHRRGVKVRIITDNNKMRDNGSQVKLLARMGIQVKIDDSKYHMHNKFGVIDGKIAFTGSYNWTYTAKQFNQENLLLTTNYRIVHLFEDEFERLWAQMFWLKVKPLKRRDSLPSEDITPGNDNLCQPQQEHNAHETGNTPDGTVSCDFNTTAASSQGHKAETDEPDEEDFPNVNPFDPEDFFDKRDANAAAAITTEKPNFGIDTRPKNGRARQYGDFWGDDADEMEAPVGAKFRDRSRKADRMAKNGNGTFGRKGKNRNKPDGKPTPKGGRQHRR